MRATCTVTKKVPAPEDNALNPAHPFRPGVFVLTRGMLFVETVDSGAKVTEGAGHWRYGAYVDGTFSSTTTKTGSNDVANLEP